MGAFLARLQGHTASDNATPLPALKVTMVSFVMAANDISLVSIYPTLPFMVASFFPELPVEQLGRRAGILGSMFNFGQLFGSLVWGRLADRYGRRPIMLVGLLGTVLSMCLFAFAVSFEMACTARFLWGALNGNIGVGKTYLSEITDDSNQARAFAWLGVSWWYCAARWTGIGWLSCAARHSSGPRCLRPTASLASFSLCSRARSASLSPLSLWCSLGSFSKRLSVSNRRHRQRRVRGRDDDERARRRRRSICAWVVQCDQVAT
jgi:MFS family permease